MYHSDVVERENEKLHLQIISKNVKVRCCLLFLHICIVHLSIDTDIAKSNMDRDILSGMDFITLRDHRRKCGARKTVFSDTFCCKNSSKHLSLGLDLQFVWGKGAL